MGFLDSVLGSVLGGGQPQGGGAGALVNIVAGMLAHSGQGGTAGAAPGGLGGLGGLAGLAEQFQRGGLGNVMSSWIGRGQNLPISADQLSKVLGSDVVGQLASHTGMDTGALLGQLTQLLPQLVDHATPDGQIPAGGAADISAVLGRFAAASQAR
jgi:uncharacterized protein YidB (DUF937 family)